MLPEHSQALFPIACRVVSTDQWLVTRFDATWKVSEVKQYILSKVGGNRDAIRFHYPPRHRPVSPITFASVHPSRNSLDTAEDSYYDYFDDYDFESDTEVFSFDPTKEVKHKQPTRGTTPQESQPPSPFTAYTVQQYPLITFSTGLILEDDYSLSWYQLRPHELLELHPPGFVVRLPREIMLEYIQPYFEAKVKALRIVWSDKDFNLDKDRDSDSKAKSGKSKADSSKQRKGPEASTSPGLDKSSLPVIRRRRKTKLEWKERWVVVNQGMLNLFKDKMDPNPVHTSPLSSLCALRGAEDLFRGTSGPRPSPHVICAKFRTSNAPPSSETVQDSQTSPIGEGWVDPWSGTTIPRETEESVAPSNSVGGGLWTRRGSKDDGGKLRKGSGGNIGKDGKKHKAKESVKDGGDKDRWKREASGDGVKSDARKKEEEGIWLILDMLDECYYDSLLRILHRNSSESTTSTFVQSPTTDEEQKPPTPPASPPLQNLIRKPHALPYPDWRVDVARKAQKAGMGDVGLAMGYIMWGESAIRHNKSGTSRKSRSSIPGLAPDVKTTCPQASEFGTDEDSDESFDSEMEWEHWEADFKRHGRSRAKDKGKGKDKEQEPISPLSPSQPDVPGEVETVRRRLARMDASISSPSSAESLWRAAREAEAAPSPLAQPAGLPSSAPPSTSPSSSGAHGRPAAERERPYSPLSPDPAAIGLDPNSLSYIHGGPALLTHPSVLPVPLSGVTTSTVSAGGIVRARSLRAYNEDGRGRGVPQAMAVLDENKAVPPDERRPAKLQKPRDGERRRIPSAPSPPAWLVPPASPTSVAGVERSTSHRWRPASAHGATGAKGRPRTGSAAPQSPPEEGPARPVSQDGLRHGIAKAVRRTKAFSPDRFVKGLDSALDFVEGK